MKKLIAFMMSAIVAAAISGCSSVQVGTKLNDQKLTLSSNADVAHVNGKIWGIYVFSAPIFTGSPTKPNNIVFGEDTVNVSSVVEMVTAKSKELGGKEVVDMKSDVSSFWFAPLLVVFIDSVQVSGNSVK